MFLQQALSHWRWVIVFSTSLYSLHLYHLVTFNLALGGVNPVTSSPEILVFINSAFYYSLYFPKHKQVKSIFKSHSICIHKSTKIARLSRSLTCIRYPTGAEYPGRETGSDSTTPFPNYSSEEMMSTTWITQILSVELPSHSFRPVAFHACTVIV